MKIRKLPNSWGKITLGQFIQLRELHVTGDDIHNLVAKLSVLSRIDPDIIYDTVKSKHIPKISRRIQFLNSMPEKREYQNFTWNGEYYKRVDVDKTTNVQVTDILSLNDNVENEGERILNVLSVVYYKGTDKVYSGDRYKAMRESLMYLPMDIAFNASGFFLSGLNRYFPNVLEVFSKKIKSMNLKQVNALRSKVRKLPNSKELEKYINGIIG